MVSVPRAMEVSVTPVPVSNGATVTAVVKRMVRWAVSAEVVALHVVSVANTAVQLSPTGKLNAGMLAGMLDGAVIVERAVEVLVTTADVLKSSSPPIPPVAPVAPVSSIRAKASSEKNGYRTQLLIASLGTYPSFYLSAYRPRPDRGFIFS